MSNEASAMGFTLVVMGLMLIFVIASRVIKGEDLKLVLNSVMHPHGTYDERQKVARGNGFKLAFLTLAGYILLVIFTGKSLELFVFKEQEPPILGLMLSVLVFLLYCIKNDAYVKINDNIDRCIGGGLGWFIIEVYRAGKNILVLKESVMSNLFSILIVISIILINIALVLKKKELKKIAKEGI